MLTCKVLTCWCIWKSLSENQTVELHLTPPELSHESDADFTFFCAHQNSHLSETCEHSCLLCLHLCVKGLKGEPAESSDLGRPWIWQKQAAAHQIFTALSNSGSDAVLGPLAPGCGLQNGGGGDGNTPHLRVQISCENLERNRSHLRIGIQASFFSSFI